MIDVLQEVVAVPLIGLSTDKIQFLQTPTIQAELEKRLDQEGSLAPGRCRKITRLWFIPSLNLRQNAQHTSFRHLVEVEIPINVQSDLKQWNQEVEDIKKKKGGHIHVKTDSNKVVIFAIPKNKCQSHSRTCQDFSQIS